MSRLKAIILAAGLSRRMGQENKLLLEVEGEPMIRRTLRAYMTCCDEVLVVTGHEADRVSAALNGLDIRLLHNPDYETGQASSVATGLRAALGADHVLVGLGDQPLLRSGHLSALIDAHLASDGVKISVPHNGQTRGNPIIIPGPLIGRMLEDKQNPGCGKFTRARPDLVDLIALSDRAYFDDVDTKEDYATLTNRHAAENAR